MTDAEAEAQYLGHLLQRADSDIGKGWGQVGDEGWDGGMALLTKWT